MMSHRREIRVLIIQTLFQHEFVGAESFDDEALRKTYSTLAGEFAPTVANDPYAMQLLDTLSSKIKEIDSIIEHATINWNLKKIGTLDKSILRLGVCEILFGDKAMVPGKVAVNEAIELAKLFLTDNGRKFISGVLGSVYAEVSDDDDTQRVPPRIEKSVGALIFREGEAQEGPSFALVYDIFNRWTLPKGKVSNAENKEDAIKRILKEKLSVESILVDELGTNSFVTHPPEGTLRKEVNYFLVKTPNPLLQLAKLDGLKEAKWFNAQDIDKLSLYPDMKKMVANGVEQVIQEYA